MNDPTKPSHRATILGALLVGFLLVVVVTTLVTLTMHSGNVREFNHNAAKVERFCGHERAAAFRAAYDPDDDSQGPMQEWVTRCQAGGGR